MEKDCEKIMSVVSSRIEVLEDMLTHENTNKKSIIKQLIEAYKTLEKYTTKDEIKEIYRKIILGYQQIDDDNENKRYDSLDYFKEIGEKLNLQVWTRENKFGRQHFNCLNDFGRKASISILTNHRMTSEEFCLIEAIENKIDFYKELVGKEELFIQYIGELDDLSFIEFEETAGKKATCVRMIQTKDGFPIYYYGGKDYDKVLEVFDEIDDYARENGTPFATDICQIIKKNSIR